MVLRYRTVYDYLLLVAVLVPLHQKFEPTDSLRTRDATNIPTVNAVESVNHNAVREITDAHNILPETTCSSVVEPSVNSISQDSGIVNGLVRNDIERLQESGTVENTEDTLNLSTGESNDLAVSQHTSVVDRMQTIICSDRSQDTVRSFEDDRRLSPEESVTSLEGDLMNMLQQAIANGTTNERILELLIDLQKNGHIGAVTQSASITIFIICQSLDAAVKLDTANKSGALQELLFELFTELASDFSIPLRPVKSCMPIYKKDLDSVITFFRGW